MIGDPDIKTIANDLTVGRKLKEALFGLIGSVQNPIDNPATENASYGGVLVRTPTGIKMAYLRLSFEDVPEILKPELDGCEPPLSSQSRWQSIETAPKDGTEVDLWHKLGFRLVDMVWFSSSPRHPNGGWAGEAPNNWHEYNPADFTHWMRVIEPLAKQEVET